ncbi:MAG: hypothetical protein EKK53_03205 [Burkholderiales bacterium]|nr:MAG: hypothetical protein EKK53_03205 [Burkholderiales bacterium]
MNALHRLTTALAFAAGCSLTMPVDAASVHREDLVCRFTASTQADGRVTVSFHLRNTSAQDVHLLNWGSPFERAWRAPFVRVQAPKGELPFEGAMRKRGDPSADDYVLLRAGEGADVSLTLNDAYTLPPEGALRLSAAWRWHDAIAAGAPPRPRERHQGLDQDCGSVVLQR